MNASLELTLCFDRDHDYRLHGPRVHALAERANAAAAGPVRPNCVHVIHDDPCSLTSQCLALLDEPTTGPRCQEQLQHLLGSSLDDICFPWIGEVDREIPCSRENPLPARAGRCRLVPVRDQLARRWYRYLWFIPTDRAITELDWGELRERGVTNALAVIDGHSCDWWSKVLESWPQA